MRGRLINVCGLIGSGKSTFTRDLSDMIGAVPLSEPAGDERNPYLSLFYENRSRWAFTMQTHLLQQRSEVHHRALEEVLGGRDVVMDSSIWQDMAYADMLYSQGEMSVDEYETYRSLARMITRETLHPDVCIYLEVPIGECFSRIQLRMEDDPRRSCETVVDLAYLEQLQTYIKRNILALENKVYFPWGDYIPLRSDRRHRIENLWCLVEDVCPSMLLN